MAESRGVRQFFRLIFDRRSAEEVKRDTQRALKDATDPRTTEQNQSRIQRGMEGIRKVALRLGGVLAAAFSVRAIVRFGNEVEESRRILVRMTGAGGAALRELQRDTRAIFAQVPDSLTEVSTAVGTLNTLLGITGEELQRVAVASLNFARINQVDVASATEVTGQLLNRFNLEAADAEGLMDRLTVAGQATGASVTGLAQNLLQAGPALSTLGFSLNQQIALMSELERRGISASEVTRRLAMSLGRFAEQGARDAGEAWEMLVDGIKNAETEMEAVSLATEAFGARGSALALDIRSGVLEIGELTRALQGADGAMASTEEHSRTAGQEFRMMGNELLAELMPAIDLSTKAVLGLGRGLMWLIRAVISGASRVVGGLTLGFLRLQEAATRAIIWTRRATGRATDEQEAALRRIRAQIAGTQEAIRMLGVRTDEDLAGPAERAGDAFDRLRRTVGDTDPPMGRLSEHLADHVKLLREGHELRTLTGQERLQAVRMEEQVTEALRQGNLALAERNALTRQQQALRGITGGPVETGLAGVDSAMGGLRGGAPQRIRREEEDMQRRKEFVDDFASHWLEKNRLMVQAAQTTGMGISRAFEDAFEAMIVGGAGAGAFLEGIFRGTAAAGLGALAEYASEQVAINLAEAASQFARSLGWSFLNPAQAAASQASAAQHLAAAGMWAAIGGASGASQRAVGGGGRAASAGGLPSGATDPHARTRDVLGELVIMVDGMDPQNPIHQERLAEAQRKAAQRGLNIRMEGR